MAISKPGEKCVKIVTARGSDTYTFPNKNTIANITEFRLPFRMLAYRASTGRVWFCFFESDQIVFGCFSTEKRDDRSMAPSAPTWASVNRAAANDCGWAWVRLLQITFRRTYVQKARIYDFTSSTLEPTSMTFQGVRVNRWSTSYSHFLYDEVWASWMSAGFMNVITRTSYDV